MTIETERYRIGGDTFSDHRIEVPLDRSGKLAGNISVFAREVVRDGQEKAPRLVFFQGGPGSTGPTPGTRWWLGGLATQSLPRHSF